MLVSIEHLPANLEEMKAMPHSTLDKPESTVALFLAAMCRYKDDKDAAVEMINFLKGPEPLNEYQKQFLRDRMMDGHDYVARSYFKGAVPENDYTPDKPYTVEVSENPYSHDNEGYVRLWVQSGGADSPRQIDLRYKPSTNQWFLFEYSGLLAGIRKPQSEDAWA